MPPKKKTAAPAAETDSGTPAFRWTAENERKLLVLTQNRPSLKAEDYDRLLTVFPGTNLNGVKIRLSRLRVEQRKLFEEYGWPSLEAKTETAGKGNGKKRGLAKDEDRTTAGEPTKKKAKKVEKEEDTEEENGVKAEAKSEDGDNDIDSETTVKEGVNA